MDVFVANSHTGTGWVNIYDLAHQQVAANGNLTDCYVRSSQISMANYDNIMVCARLTDSTANLSLPMGLSVASLN